MNKQEKIKALTQKRTDLLKKVEDSKHKIQEESEVILALLGVVSNLAVTFTLDDTTHVIAKLEKEPHREYKIRIFISGLILGTTDLGTINMVEKEYEIKNLVKFNQAFEKLAVLVTEERIFDKLSDNFMENEYTLTTDDYWVR